MKLQILMQEEYSKGHASGMEAGIISALLGLMRTTCCSAEEALKMCNIPENERETYLDLLTKQKEEQ